jgi:hypothetical protein
MPGGVFEIAVLIAVVIGAFKLLPRQRLIEDFREIFDDVPATPRAKPEVQRLRDGAAL